MLINYRKPQYQLKSFKTNFLIMFHFSVFKLMKKQSKQVFHLNSTSTLLNRCGLQIKYDFQKYVLVSKLPLH